MNWDDLRVVRAVYETGSYAAAAAQLRIDETTVSRRLARLQRDLGMSLFKAQDGVRIPTDDCETIVAHAISMADHANAIERVHDGAPTISRRRIAATDSVSAYVLAPNAPAFLSDNPNIILDFKASTENVDFSRWQADIAIRLSKPEKGDFLVSKLAEFDLFLCTPARRKVPEEVLICAYPEELDETPETKILLKRGLHQKARCTTKNLAVMSELLHTQSCAGILPSYMCEDLIDNGDFKAEKLPRRRGAWLLVQRHLKDDIATRAVIDWIKACFAGIKA